ncbi:g3314 [Coccomyxa viridis]|uniref:G3314 protein n=1 Tax=Coccomyxa viridis TaxID=1274662 RepID=A0ABP1FP41_9CHLO
MGGEGNKKQWSQAVTHVLCIGGGAAVSAAICGYLVTRKIQAYAEVLRKASENLESRDKHKEQNDQEKAKTAKSAPEHEAILPYKKFEDLTSPFDVKLPSIASISAPTTSTIPPAMPAAYTRPGDVSEAGRSATAPLAKVSSAHEDAALEPMLDAGGFTPFGAPFAQSPQPSVTLPLSTITFESSSLFQNHPTPTLLPQGSNLAKTASHAVHPDRSVLPPKSPSTVDSVPLIGSADTWRGSKGSSLGIGSRTNSEDLDNMRTIPQLLRTRNSGAVGTTLPELGALLGRGSFGKVYKGRWKGAMVAVKIIEHSADINSKIEGFRENVVSSNIQHPNVLITYKAITCGQHGMISGQQAGSLDSASGSKGECPAHVSGQPPKYASSQHSDFEEIQETWLLSEFCDKGNLDRALSGGRFHDKATGKPEMVAIYRCLLDIAAGMDYLHSLGVLHGDLKGGNVLMKSTSMYDDPRGFVCKLGDFGLSRVLEHNSTHVSTNTYGTVSYCAPELLKEGKLTKAADVYSFAMMMWEMYSGTALFRGMNSSQVFFKIITGYRPQVPADMPEGYAMLMKACWHECPEERPPFEDVVNYLRTLYLDVKNGSGKTRDARRSLDLNPWG